jgi:hypothetical protein
MHFAVRLPLFHCIFISFSRPTALAIRAFKKDLFERSEPFLAVSRSSNRNKQMSDFDTGDVGFRPQPVLTRHTSEPNCAFRGLHSIETKEFPGA